jgi:single-stranded-DNA-specific exonuclease
MKHLLTDVFRKIERNEGVISPFAIVLWDPQWHEGILGIAASKIVETYGRPAVLISLKENKGKGSIRGTEGLNIYQALQTCAPLLVSFGGHPLAGGISIKESKIAAFAKSFSSALESQCHGKPVKTKVFIDAFVKSGDLTRKFFDELQILAPFGPGNPSPLLGFYGYKLKTPRLLKEKHIKFSLSSGNSFEVQGIAFNSGKWFKKLNLMPSFFAIPTYNTWNGHTAPQLVVRKFVKESDLSSIETKQ